MVAGDVSRRDASWDIRFGPRNYITLVAAQVASAFFSFATVWLATHYLGSAGYGSVVAVLAAAQFIMQIALNWTAISLTRYGCEEFVETGLVSKAFWGRLLILVANLGIVLITFPFLSRIFSQWLRLPANAAFLILLYLLAASFWLHVQQALQAAKLQRLQGVLMAVERAVIFVVVLGLALAGTASLFSLALAYVSGAVCACLIGIWQLRFLIWPVSRLDPGLFKQLIRFSLPLIPFSVIGYFSTNYLDAWFIARYLSISDLGVYAVAYQLIGVSMQLPLLAGTLLMPLFITLQTTGRREGITRFVSEVLPVLTLAWSITCVLVAVVGSYFLPLVFGSQFARTGELLWPLMAASALACPVLIAYGPLANATSATYIPAAAALVAALVNVVLNMLLIPRFGLPGCAWATAGAYAMSTIIAASLMHRRANLNQSWIVQATLPAVIGAAFAYWSSGRLLALFAALVSTTFIALLHRRSIASGLVTLNNQRNLRNGLSAQVSS